MRRRTQVYTLGSDYRLNIMQLSHSTPEKPTILRDVHADIKFNLNFRRPQKDFMVSLKRVLTVTHLHKKVNNTSREHRGNLKSMSIYTRKLLKHKTIYFLKQKCVQAQLDNSSSLQQDTLTQE